MSLFINHDEHQKVYRSDAEIIALNQDVFKQDTTLEMIEAQKQANDALRSSLQALEASSIKQARIQSRKLESVQHNLKQFNDRHVKQQEMENDMARLLEKYNKKNEVLSLKIEQQIELQKEMAHQVSHQEDFQVDVIDRLDKQEALTERLNRKIDHFRSIIYERTNFLTEKIEKGYHSTTDYIHNMMIIKKEPTTSKEKQENSE